jgi:SRSO17 transposase/transposase
MGVMIEAVDVTSVQQWTERFTQLYDQIAHRFGRREVRQRARRYVLGLLSKTERKNGWQVAEEIGDDDPQGVQRLLNAASWDADEIRDDLRDYVVTHLGDEESGILIVDETGFLKKGTKSCGVAPQYTGTAGATVNAQVGVFLAYASSQGAAFIDRALYLPQEWVLDRDRRDEAGIPSTTRFMTKITLAQQLLERAFTAAVPARWVVADAFYGRSHTFRRWLETRKQPYVTMIPKSNAVEYRGQREWAEQLGERLTEEMWTSRSSGPGSQGERIHDWACLMLSEPTSPGMGRWLLIRRDPEGSNDHRYWLAYGPDGTPVAELVWAADARWQVEECFAQAKGEVGLDHYEVRIWTAWHRFVTLALLAHAFLVVLRLYARREAAGQQTRHAAVELIPLTVSEVRRLVLAWGDAPEKQRFRFAWSRWRRAHQAVAARCHALRQLHRRHERVNDSIMLPPARLHTALTEREWQRVQPVLPPQRPWTGRPRHDHRTVLNGILAIVGTERSWREMPAEYGKWEAAYKRYRLWCDEGRWERIIAALTGEDDDRRAEVML